MRLSCIFDKTPPGLRHTKWLQFPMLGSAIRLQNGRIRPFMTNMKLNDGIAAPEINFDTIDHIRRNTNQPADVKELKGEQDKTQYARVVPESRSYFTVQPNFTDTLISFDKILENNQKLPVSDSRDAPKVAWLSGREYKNMIGEKVKNSRYQQMLQVLKRLNQIHPAVMPSEVEKALDTFKHDTVPEAASTKISPIDGFGRSLGVGRRKTSTARAWLVEGTGEVLVNGKTLSEAFGRIHDRETVIWPLKATMRVDKYNLWCRVEGGGTTGQAESLTLAVAKALLGHEPALKPALRRAGCITRDPRKVERKKPGHVKARKMPAWVKR